MDIEIRRNRDLMWSFEGPSREDLEKAGIIPKLTKEQQEGCFTRLEGHYPGRVHQRVLMTMPWPAFPTREALCEHYRKIFE